jgi:hypothetical protein
MCGGARSLAERRTQVAWARGSRYGATCSYSLPAAGRCRVAQRIEDGRTARSLARYVPIACHRRNDMDQTHRIAVLVGIRTGYAGDGHHEIGRNALQSSVGHRQRDLTADGGVPLNEGARHADDGRLGGLGVDHEPRPGRRRWHPHHQRAGTRVPRPCRTPQSPTSGPAIWRRVRPRRRSL